MFESARAVGQVCRKARKQVEGARRFPLPYAAAHLHEQPAVGRGEPTDVQELLGHSDVNTTMSIYAHATREAKRTSARLLDKVVGGE